MNTLAFSPRPRHEARANVSTVYHIQRLEALNGALLRRADCTVLVERVQLEGCAHPTTIYTPVYCLGPAERVLLHLPRALASRALYAVRQGGAMLIYPPYLGEATWFGERTLLPIHSRDCEAMFQIAAERSQAMLHLSASDEDATLKLPRPLCSDVRTRAMR